MKITFSSKAWENYLYWQKTDKAILKRINTLIKHIQRNPFEGIGKPEPEGFKMSESAQAISTQRSIFRYLALW